MNIKKELRYRMFLDRFPALRDLRDGLVCLRWASRHAGAPFPPTVKRAFLRDLAEKYQLELLVETGTFLGDTSADLARSFRRVYTIEAAKELFDVVGPRFTGIANVQRVFGDSGTVLAAILP
jgi:predicted O-methyltransferase YrrM